MTTPTKSTPLPIIVPVSDETRAMLDYASSPEGRAKIENGRREIRDGEGIIVDECYFADLSRRISERVARARRA